MVSRFPHQLQRLNDFSRLLAESKSLKEVKAIRDKAEAARHFAQSAALGLRIQNQAAELKLRAERKAGALLVELAPHGGNRKSSYQDGNLKLSDLGINANQSARWRREAAVSEDVFERYLAMANELETEITAQGLLRLERLVAKKEARSSAQFENCRNFDFSSTPLTNGKAPEQDANNQVRELFYEINNHHILLESVLKPVCEGTSIAIPERRVISRLLRECKELLSDLGDLVGIARPKSNQRVPFGRN
jgi:hypothetical protein